MPGDGGGGGDDGDDGLSGLVVVDYLVAGQSPSPPPPPGSAGAVITLTGWSVQVVGGHSWDVM